jgi:hypothetical protein
MTGTRFSRLAAGLAVIALAATLSACAPEPEPTAAPTDSTESSSPTPTTSASSSPVAEETAAPSAASCESLLDLATLEAILMDGFDVNPVNDYILKIRGEGSPYALFDEYGGLVCPVNNGTRVSELYAYSAITPDQQATQEARLVAEGFTSSAVDGGTLYVQPPQEGIVFAFYFRNGYWWCGYDPGVIDMIVANSPES